MCFIWVLNYFFLCSYFQPSTLNRKPKLKKNKSSEENKASRFTREERLQSSEACFSSLNPSLGCAGTAVCPQPLPFCGCMPCHSPVMLTLTFYYPLLLWAVLYSLGPSPYWNPFPHLFPLWVFRHSFLILLHPLCAQLSFWQTYSSPSQFYINPLDEWASFFLLTSARPVFKVSALFFQGMWTCAIPQVMPCLAQRGTLDISAGKKSPQSLDTCCGYGSFSMLV